MNIELPNGLVVRVIYGLIGLFGGWIAAGAAGFLDTMSMSGFVAMCVSGFGGAFFLYKLSQLFGQKQGSRALLYGLVGFLTGPVVFVLGVAALVGPAISGDVVLIVLALGAVAGAGFGVGLAHLFGTKIDRSTHDFAPSCKQTATQLTLVDSRHFGWDLFLISLIALLLATNFVVTPLYPSGAILGPLVMLATFVYCTFLLFWAKRRTSVFDNEKQQVIIRKTGFAGTHTLVLAYKDIFSVTLLSRPTYVYDNLGIQHGPFFSSYLAIQKQDGSITSLENYRKRGDGGEAEKTLGQRISAFIHVPFREMEAGKAGVAGQEFEHVKP